jgi:hypothetical protein
MEFEEQSGQINSGKEYDRLFEGIPQEGRLRLLEHAIENRRSEINLYWTRSAYLWVFIAAIFAGFFGIVNADKISTQEKDNYLLLISSGGLIFSFGWYLANRGSKFWQENWEKHVDMLERLTIGPLYRTTLDHSEYRFSALLGPLKVSVSRINDILSFFVVLVWLFLWCKSISDIYKYFEPISNYNNLIVIIGTICFVYLLYTKTKPRHDTFKFKTGHLGEQNK